MKNIQNEKWQNDKLPIHILKIISETPVNTELINRPISNKEIENVFKELLYEKNTWPEWFHREIL